MENTLPLPLPSHGRAEKPPAAQCMGVGGGKESSALKPRQLSLPRTAERRPPTGCSGVAAWCLAHPFQRF